MIKVISIFQLSLNQIWQLYPWGHLAWGRLFNTRLGRVLDPYGTCSIRVSNKPLTEIQNDLGNCNIKTRQITNSLDITKGIITYTRIPDMARYLYTDKRLGFYFSMILPALQPQADWSKLGFLTSHSSDEISSNLPLYLIFLYHHLCVLKVVYI